jgi:hypothetical protein
MKVHAASVGASGNTSKNAPKNEVFSRFLPEKGGKRGKFGVNLATFVYYFDKGQILHIADFKSVKRMLIPKKREKSEGGVGGGLKFPGMAA